MAIIIYVYHTYPVSKVHGANIGPTWVPSAPDGAHVGPRNIAIRVFIRCYNHTRDHHIAFRYNDIMWKVRMFYTHGLSKPAFGILLIAEQIQGNWCRRLSERCNHTVSNIIPRILTKILLGKNMNITTLNSCFYCFQSNQGNHIVEDIICTNNLERGCISYFLW